MEKLSKLTEFCNESDVFERATASIENDLSNLKKIVDNVNQMRVEVAYLESDLMTTIDAKTWENVSQLIGLTAGSMIDVCSKKENLENK